MIWYLGSPRSPALLLIFPWERLRSVGMDGCTTSGILGSTWRVYSKGKQSKVQYIEKFPNGSASCFYLVSLNGKRLQSVPFYCISFIFFQLPRKWLMPRYLHCANFSLSFKWLACVFTFSNWTRIASACLLMASTGIELLSVLRYAVATVRCLLSLIKGF